MIGRRRRAPDIDRRVSALQAALDTGGDRLDPEAVKAARAVLDRTGERLRLGADRTVVALAGATGSGKSTLFNALAGVEIAEVSPRRPTTGTPTACVWGLDGAGAPAGQTPAGGALAGGAPAVPDDGADALLDWLEVPRRHRVNRETVLDADREAPLHGLVLLDLPDHDSTVASHRLEVDRLVHLVDLLIWVVDPQKYADEALHTGYLHRLAGHDEVMLVVLNQVDRLPPDAIETCRRDLRRLLDADGLAGVRVLTAAGLTGEGVDNLRTVLSQVVKNHAVVAERAAADLDAAARELALSVAPREAEPRDLPGTDRLVEVLGQSAGVPAVLDAVAADYRRRGGAAVGWPFTRWVRRFRPDPLRRLRLGPVEAELRQLTRSSLPAATPAQQARVELALRDVTTAAAAELPPRWAAAVRGAVTSGGGDLSDALDQAVTGVPLDLRAPRWWALWAVAQVMFAAAAVVGFGWLVALGVLSWLRLPLPEAPSVGAVPVPTLLLLGGVLLGLLLSLGGRLLVGWGAGRRRDRTASRLNSAIHTVVEDRVLGPVLHVLRDHRATREALLTVPR